jgi:hypothetical protein
VVLPGSSRSAARREVGHLIEAVISAISPLVMLNCVRVLAGIEAVTTGCFKIQPR